VTIDRELVAEAGVMEPPRSILPIPDRAYAGLMPYDAKEPDAKFAPIAPLRPPEGAPNVLVVLIDDVGFGASSAFGGPVDTPVAERLAAQGLKYTRFHTTALCSPTRAALIHRAEPPHGRHGRSRAQSERAIVTEGRRRQTSVPLA
jgi:hypothetical protein